MKQEFKGVIKLDVRDSKSDWTPYELKRAPDGAPIVAAPQGAVIVTLPAGCTTTVVGGVTSQQCGSTYYQRVNTGYRVVVF